MKLNYWFLTAMTAGAIVASAQDTNLVMPPMPAPSAPAETTAAPETKSTPAKHRPKKARAKKKNQDMKFDPPVTGVAKDAVVNVRGQPSLVGEVVGHIKKGDTVTVYETITLASREKDEPSKWDRIDMPTNHLVWVDAQFVDAATQTVKAKKLNVRGGPGENYSVVDRLEKGAPIVEVRKEKGWIGINPPTNAYAYVAAECLTLGPAVAPAAPAPAPAPAPVVAQAPAEAAPVPQPQPEPSAPAPTPASQTEQELAALHQAEQPPASTGPAAAPTPAADLPTRVVTREGFVHKAYNIQAPADYELHDIKTGEVIDYLQPSAKQNFKMYIGTRISVTGIEVMDSHWPRTPILQVQSVDLVP